MNKTADVPKASQLLLGFFDNIHEGYAYGWACDTSSPAEKITVDIFCGDRLVGQGVAKDFRQDLLDAGIGDGYYSFKIPLSYELNDGTTHELIAKASKNSTILQEGVKIMTPQKTAKEFDLINRTESLLFFSKIIDHGKNLEIQTKKESYLKAFNFACMLQETGKSDDARYAWKAFETAIGKNELFYCKTAETFMLDTQYEQALEFYLKAASEDVRWYWPHLGIGNAYRMLEKYSEALASFKVAQALGPEQKSIAQRITNINSLVKNDNPLPNYDHSRLVNLLFSSNSPHTQTTETDKELKTCSLSSTAQQIDAFVRELKKLELKINKINTVREAKKK
ncbi:hypothetical protein IFR09_20640 [Pseudomonas syringae]|nr:hypothetical protein [Pseudomonas syringae]MBD8802858.1 hypothetical protein [Pseudomonas syringae]MBD8813570.1 hypothetical protein [Pseudomonas syringae]